MANKCQHCGKFLSAADGAKCTKCPSMFHRACVNLSPESRIPQKWMCRNCRSSGYIKCLPASLPNVERNDEELNADSADESSLVREMKLLRAELAMVSGEMTSFRLELAKLNSCITGFNNRVDSIEERLSSLEQQKAGSNIDRDDISQEVVAQLRLELNDREQECFSNDIEISGLTEKPGENVLQIVTLVAKKIGVNLQDVDIVSAQRSGPRRDTLSSGEQLRPRPITVRLTRRALRDDMLRAARVRRGADSSSVIDGEPRRFYVNERLTKLNRFLFYKAKEECRNKGWKYVWTKGGRIYVRRAFDALVQRVRVEGDLKKIFGASSI